MTIPGEPFEDSAFVAAELARPRHPNPSLPRSSAASLTLGFAHPLPLHSGSSRASPSSSVSSGPSAPRAGKPLSTELQHARPPSSPSPNRSRQPHHRQPLTQATSDVFLRFKSAAVLWQLRDLLGEEVFRQSLLAWRTSLTLNPSFARDPTAFEKSLEQTSTRDLAWFFHDWVYRDRGLPDLTIVQATPRPLPPSPARPAGYLVAVDVRNDGDAVADVPVTVRAVVTSRHVSACASPPHHRLHPHPL